jgi:hypothetical protein
MTIDVFMSVGRTATERQEAFVREVERLLLEHDLKPHNLGRTEYSADQPLKAIESLMDRCSGTVVISFERLFVEQGVEQRGGPKPKLIESQGLTTVWNQIEAAMAYVKRHPLLVFAEDGVIQQGLLSHGHDWHVQRLDLDPAVLRSPESIGRLEEWKTRVALRAKKGVRQTRLMSPGDMTIAELIGAMRPNQLYAVVLAVFAILSAAVVLARQIP